MRTTAQDVTFIRPVPSRTKEFAVERARIIPALAWLGWDDTFADAFAALAPSDPGLRPGRRHRIDRGTATVLTGDGPVARQAHPGSADPNGR